MLLRERMESFPFSNSEQIIIDYLLKEGIHIEDKTTTQIASETYTSKSTLVRIVQKLNYTGWSDFKKNFIEEIIYLEKFVSEIDANYPFDKSDSIMSVASKVAVLEKESIDDTLSLLTHNTLRKAINILSSKQTIHVFAVSNNLLISQKFFPLLHQREIISLENHLITEQLSNYFWVT